MQEWFISNCSLHLPYRFADYAGEMIKICIGVHCGEEAIPPLPDVDSFIQQMIEEQVHVPGEREPEKRTAIYDTNRKLPDSKYFV
jgi:hypothetical protein